MSKIIVDNDGRQFICSKKRLGQGTFAEVLLGEWTNAIDETGTERIVKVAIKQFRDFNKHSGLLNAEIEIMKKLDHPNIVKMITAIYVSTPQSGEFVLDTDDEPGLYVVLEYCGGGDFKHFIRGKRMSEKHACGFMKQLKSGLQYLHSKGIVHRDLKPHNILLSSDYKTLKIADFGFARVIDAEALAATMCGSPLYMAPEVIRGEQYGANADLWSVGVILYEMLCGERPFNDVASIVALKQALTQEPIRFKREVKESISSDCKELLIGLLQKDAKKRIDFEAFFNHIWFAKTDWNSSGSESATKRSAAAAVAVPRTAPIKIPAATPAQSTIKRGLVTDYVNRLSSAPVRAASVPAGLTDAVSPPSQTSRGGVNGSVFLSTTPQGQSDPLLLGSSNSAAAKSRSGVFSDVFSLFKDSFQNNGY